MKRSVVAVALVALLGGSAQAQFPEDALRFATPGLGVGARAIGMGGAYTGVASDYSAIFWNPAGLAQATYGEFSAGLSYAANDNTSSFFNAQQGFSTNATNLNTLGIVHPLPVRRGSAVLAFGFHRQSSFANGVSFSGFNGNSSIIQTFAPDGGFYPSDLSGNVAYQLYLANLDTTTGRFDSPIRDRLTQIGKVVEGGGLNNWSIAGAVDVAKNFAAGMTLTYLGGSYRYDRNYREEDTRGVYQAFPFDFSSMTLDDFIESDIAGWNAKFGIMFREENRFRIGFAVRTPTEFTIREKFGTTARSYFDNGDMRPADAPFNTEFSSEYDVVTPWVLSGGVSVIIRDLVLSGDVEFTDWTTLEFRKANSDVMAQNADMKTIFQPAVNYRAGAEFDIHDIGLRLRGGFVYNKSPFRSDPVSFDQKYITGGLGILVGESTMIDIAYARGWWETFVYNYNATSRVNESMKTNTFMLTLTHRF
ncbi:MAG: outer membrane protein transport protein [Bacteroidota bacterium]